MRESKDKIKSRMLRNAAQIWGFQDPQPESTFDPVVSLLIGACSFELEKISREIFNTESRIIERLVNIMTPQPITSPHPAYAVAFAKPSAKGAKVFPENQFYVNIKVNDEFDTRSEEKQIFFSPTGTYGLTDGRVRYIAAYKRVFEFVDEQYKDIIAEMNKSPLSPTSMYIGLEMNEKPTDLTLFFDIINDHLKQAFFNELKTCQFKIGNRSIPSDLGIRNKGPLESEVNHLLNRVIDLSSKISHHVNRYFQRQFVNLDLKDIDFPGENDAHSLPGDFYRSIDQKELSALEKNVVWIELQFTSPLSEEVLESLVCSLNCFPVINKRLNEFTGSTREMVNIIPLHTDDVFFDLKCITNSDGDVYRISHFDSQGDLSKGSALLRMDGVGRFDARNAMEFLEYLLELMKEERAAFNVIGSDMISSNLRELNQSIARLEKKIEDVQLEKGDTAYLMVKPQEGDRQVFVEFWSTNCSLANNVRAGSQVNIYQAEDLDYNATKLMTKTTGGKEKPSTESRINTYRRFLQSGDRVVTIEDIKALCLEQFGEHISQVEIIKGIDRGNIRSEGLIRTIEIHLTIKKGLEMNASEQGDFIQKLQVMLESRSTNILPFRIFINQ
jgi:hypothetical protein